MGPSEEAAKQLNHHAGLPGSDSKFDPNESLAIRLWTWQSKQGSRDVDAQIADVVRCLQVLNDELLELTRGKHVA